MDYFLRTIQVKNGNVLDAVCDIFDGEIDADWTGENEKVFWSLEAQALNKPDKQIVEEELRTRTFANEYDIVNDYIAEYKERYGNYYDVIDFTFIYNESGNIIALAMVFIRED